MANPAVGLSDPTFSLTHVLIVSAFGAAISIAVNDRDGARPQRRALRRLLRRLLRRKIAPRYRTHHAETSPGPLRQSMSKVLTELAYSVI